MLHLSRSKAKKVFREAKKLLREDITFEQFLQDEKMEKFCAFWMPCLLCEYEEESGRKFSARNVAENIFRRESSHKKGMLLSTLKRKMENAIASLHVKRKADKRLFA